MEKALAAKPARIGYATAHAEIAETAAVINEMNAMGLCAYLVSLLDVGNREN